MITKPKLIIIISTATFSLVSTTSVFSQQAKPPYPTKADVIINGQNDFYSKIASANQTAKDKSGSNPKVYIRINTSKIITLDRPVYLNPGNKKVTYVFYRASGQNKAILDGKNQTPFYANSYRPFEGNAFTQQKRINLEFYNIDFRNFKHNIGRSYKFPGKNAQKINWPAAPIAYLDNGYVWVVDCRIVNAGVNVALNLRGQPNRSEWHAGGAIRTVFGTIKVWGSAFNRCYSLTGGAIHASHSNFEATGSVFKNCVAAGGIDGIFSGSYNWNSEGGAVRIDDLRDGAGKTVYLKDCRFERNQTQTPINAPLANVVKNQVPAPNIGQSATAFNIFNKQSISGSGARILNITGGAFTNNKKGENSVVRVLNTKQNFTYPVLIKNVNFAKNGQVSGAGVKTQCVVRITNGPAEEKLKNVKFNNNTVRQNTILK